MISKKAKKSPSLELFAYENKLRLGFVASVSVSVCLQSLLPTILDRTVDTNPLSPEQCRFEVARRAHGAFNCRLKLENVCRDNVLGGGARLTFYFKIYGIYLGYFIGQRPSP